MQTVEESVARGDSPDVTQHIIDETAEHRRQSLVTKLRQLILVKEQFDLWEDAWHNDFIWDDHRGPTPGPRMQIYSFATAYSNAINRPSAASCAYINLMQLNLIRAYSRAFCLLNPYWWAIQQNLANYVVENGHTYSVTPRTAGKKIEDSELQDVQDVIDMTCKKNVWSEYQCEKLRRGDRDGEFIIRKFHVEADEEDKPGKRFLSLRFIEPRLLWDPMGKSMVDGVWFGIQFRNNDFQLPRGYYLRPADYLGNTDAEGNAKWSTMIKPEEIQHRKFNVDLADPRGVPTTYAISDRLQQALKTVQAMGKLVHFREKVALIRQHVGSTVSAIKAFLGDEPSTHTDANGVKKLDDFQGDGLIFDTTGNMNMQFPSQHVDTDKIVHAVKAELQAAAGAMGLAEFIFADPSGGKFASSIVSEGPMDKTIRRRQAQMVTDDIEILEEAVKLAAEDGTLKGDVLTRVKIKANVPTTISRNRLADTQADQLLVQSKAMSPQSMAERAQLDPDHEVARMKEHDKEFPPEEAGGLGARTLPGRQKTTVRPVPAKDEPGPKANPQKAKESVEEWTKPNQEDEAMAKLVFPDGWFNMVKTSLLMSPGLTAPLVEYETGVIGQLRGQADGKGVWAVDMDAMSIAHNEPELTIAGNNALWPFIPSDRIVINGVLRSPEWLHWALHELVEQKLMEAGWGYARAHRYAQKAQMEYMVELRPTLDALKPKE